MRPTVPTPCLARVAGQGGYCGSSHRRCDLPKHCHEGETTLIVQEHSRLTLIGGMHDRDRLKGWCPMEVPLTPMDFARRARRLYGDREAVVDGDLRLTYAQFFDRCDRWSSALQALGSQQGDRVAYIAPNTHAHLEAYYAVPQIGAVLVPINYRLLPDDFEYIINHCGAKIVCALTTSQLSMVSETGCLA